MADYIKLVHVTPCVRKKSYRGGVIDVIYNKESRMWDWKGTYTKTLTMYHSGTEPTAELAEKAGKRWVDMYAGA